MTSLFSSEKASGLAYEIQIGRLHMMSLDSNVTITKAPFPGKCPVTVDSDFSPESYVGT